MSITVVTGTPCGQPCRSHGDAPSDLPRPFMARQPTLASFLRLTEYVAGVVDLPALRPARGALTPSDAHTPTRGYIFPRRRSNGPCFLSRIASREPSTAIPSVPGDLLKALDYDACPIAAHPNGKPLHILEMLNHFAWFAESEWAYHERLLETGLP